MPVSNTRRGRRFGPRCGRAGYRIRRGVVLRADLDRKGRRCGRHDAPAVRGGAGIRGREPSGGARPREAGFHNWWSVGAATRPFRWRPVLQRTGRERGLWWNRPNRFSRWPGPSWNCLPWRMGLRCGRSRCRTIASIGPPRICWAGRRIAAVSTATGQHTDSPGSKSVRNWRGTRWVKRWKPSKSEWASGAQ